MFKVITNIYLSTCVPISVSFSFAPASVIFGLESVEKFTYLTPKKVKFTTHSSYRFREGTVLLTRPPPAKRPAAGDPAVLFYRARGAVVQG